ncbi:MAG: DNA-directed RNA polymerase subunit A'' [Nanoarchaeota archaeon]|nr:DNA-directed RNA polymerase subunit A'' [Nanoarchaeota archaeon]
MYNLPTKIQEEILKYTEENKISEKQQQQIIDAVTKIHKMSTYDPQEPMGVVAAQSISEPATQMTMRTYHFAGTAGIQVTLGLPRVLEIFDARKEPRTPTMTIYIEKSHQTLDRVRKIAENIKEVKLRDLVKSTILDLTELKIKYKLDLERLHALDVDEKKLSRLVNVRNAVAELAGEMLHVIPKKKDITNIHKIKFGVLEAHVKGIKGITQVLVTKEEGEWVINTLGSNLKKVFEIEGVDATRTTSNNIFEILDVLGVEAARNAIIKQTRFTLDEQGLVVDPRYIMLLADMMTTEGNVKAIGRYGISGEKDSVLVRASFEETKKHLTSAAIHGECDLLKGTIENIMVNQVAPVGTGAFDLVGKIPQQLPEEEK